MWSTLWTGFTSGPDWYYETDIAIKLTEKWRTSVITQKKFSSRPIIDILGDAKEPCFFAFGRRTANDFLHTLAIFPGAPAIYVCTSDVRFDAFLHGIVEYMATWAGSDYIDGVGGITNSDNPFVYNYKSYQFNRQHILVFRKAVATIPQLLFNKMMNEGLFNPEHSIGTSCFSFVFVCFCSMLTIMIQGIRMNSHLKTSCAQGRLVECQFIFTMAWTVTQSFEPKPPVAGKIGVQR